MFSLSLQAFVCTFSKALHVEYRAKGIIIQVGGQLWALPSGNLGWVGGTLSSLAK